jgi:hypothetical protein
MTALQNIIKEAKSLKKSFPKRFKKWTDYVKQASAIYASKHKGKSPVGKKKVVKKKLVKKKVAKKTIKKRIVKKPSEKVILKKIHTAKGTSKNLYNQLDKLDEAQHAHMAKRIGAVNNERLKHYQEIIKKIEFNERSLYFIEKALKDKKNSLMVRNFHKKHATDLKKYLKELKIQKAELKKLL